MRWSLLADDVFQITVPPLPLLSSCLDYREVPTHI